MEVSMYMRERQKNDSNLKTLDRNVQMLLSCLKAESDRKDTME